MLQSDVNEIQLEGTIKTRHIFLFNDIVLLTGPLTKSIFNSDGFFEYKWHKFLNEVYIDLSKPILSTENENSLKFIEEKLIIMWQSKSEGIVSKSFTLKNVEEGGKWHKTIENIKQQNQGSEDIFSRSNENSIKLKTQSKSEHELSILTVPDHGMWRRSFAMSNESLSSSTSDKEKRPSSSFWLRKKKSSERI